jgi:CubicO group peptidase (beta-lactamase class C family)
MTTVRELLERHVESRSAPGAVALVARGNRIEAEAVGCADVEASGPMARDSLLRIASMTKPIVAAATMILVEDGTVALDDPVTKWLPELASPPVACTPDAIVPLVLGDGARPFGGLGDARPKLEQLEAVEAPGVTHIRYELAR